jgi:hypothetical protein
MPPRFLSLLTLLAVGAGAPAWAQTVGSTPDIVVERLMSFDRNADGRLVIAELPERMQGLVARGDASNDAALDSAEIRRLAMSPTPQLPVRNVLQVNQYGFGDSFSFDSSRHIEGALDDLRLAADTKDRAVEVAQTFLQGLDARALDTLMSTLGSLLNELQLADFQRAFEGQATEVAAVRIAGGVTFFGATKEEAAGQERVIVKVRVSPSDLEGHLTRYGLDASRQEQALAAIRQFRVRGPARMNDAERSALLAQFRPLLSDEQIDDLRAALMRRPVVQMTGITDPLRMFTTVQVVAPRPTEPVGTVELHRLLLTR